MTSKLTTTQLQFVDADGDNSVTLSANTSSGTISLGGAILTNVSSPTDASHVTTKEYVDSVASGLDVKQSVRVATTEAGTLTTSFTAGEIIDGVTLATGDRILIKNQSTASENGIRTVNASGAPTRATDFDEDAEVTSGAFTFVEQGTTNGSNGYVLATSGSIQIGVTALTFSQFSSTGEGASTLADLSDVLVEDNSLYIGNDPSDTTSSAQRNIAIGATALESITTGDNNVAVGYQAGAALTDGTDNVLVGYEAGALLDGLEATNATQNVVIGAGAASQSAGLYRGVVVGHHAGYLARSSYNTLIGWSAGDSLTTGYYNTVLGSSAGDSLTTGHSNTVIGRNADTHSASGINQTVIGHGAAGVADNSVTLGDSNVTDVYCASDKSAVLHAGSIRVADGGAIGSVSKTDAITISAAGVVDITAATASSSATTGALKVAGGAGIAGDLSVGDDLRLSSDSAVLSFGADEDVTLTHVTDTGLLLNANMQLQFRDSAIHISSDADGHLNARADTGITLNIGGTDRLSVGASDSTLRTNLKMDQDDARIQFGGNSEITMTHVHNTGLEFYNENTSPFTLSLAAGHSSVTAGDKMGVLNFQAPDAGDEDHDAVLVCAGIEAVSEGTFGATSNATKLSFKTASSEAAAEKMKLDSTGVLTLNGPSGSLVIPDAGTIGSASDTNAIGISSGGVVSISATTASSSTTTGALTVGGGAGIAGALYVGGQAYAAAFQATSDSRLKSDVVEIAGAVGKIQQIRGVDFVWKESGKSDTGVIAQEVEQVLPHVVSETEAGTKTVDYSRITALLIQAVKEQQDQIDELKAIIAKQ